jgi:phenylpropionate dioxygenase-like ring-hydroxylating dioxygenase large terminal subunit
MRPTEQEKLARTLLSHASEGTTFTSGTVAHNPVAAYADTGRWARERHRLFRRHPVVVGLSAQLREPGDWVTFELPDLPLLVVRGDDGRARCFVNACRHRGAMLATEPCGHGRAIACPFHAWSYRLDGSLLAIPDPAGFPGIDPATHLHELACTERFGLVWARADSDRDRDVDGSVDLEDHLGADLLDELDSYGFEGFHHFRSTSIDVEANWKLMYDTFLEFYHGTYIHRSTLAHLMLRNLVHFDRLGHHWRMAAAKKSLLSMAEQAPEEWRVLDHAVVSYDIFPNLAVNFHGDHVAVYRVLPGADVGRSVWHFSLLTPEPVTTEKAERYFAANFDYIVRTGMEDVGAASSIERTLRSGANEALCYGGFEPVLAWFHERVAAELAHDGPGT